MRVLSENIQIPHPNIWIYVLNYYLWLDQISKYGVFCTDLMFLIFQSPRETVNDHDHKNCMKNQKLATQISMLTSFF